MLRYILCINLFVLGQSIYELSDMSIVQEVIIGNTSIQIIDNFFKNIDLVKEVGREPTDWNVGYYPGVRNKLLQKPDNPYFDGRTCGICELTTKPEDLIPYQKMPHADGFGLEALLVYLDDREDDGTAFYRHIESGKINTKDMSSGSIIQNELQYVKEDDGYISNSNDRWELVYKVEMKKNRALIYNGNIFHSAYIKNFRKGRETFNCFTPVLPRVPFTFEGERFYMD